MTTPRLGSNICDLYAAREAEQRRQRLWSYFYVGLALILAYGAVEFLGGEQLWDYLSWK